MNRCFYWTYGLVPCWCKIKTVYSEVQNMFHRCRRRGSAGEGLIGLLIIGIILFPITGFGLLLFGENEKQRGIGIGMIVVTIIVGLIIRG